MDLLETLIERYPDQTMFLQTVSEVFEDVHPLVERDQVLQNLKILERLAEPDRIIQFRVTWQNEKGEFEVNRGWRVQHSNAIGPYKGGLRFHPGVSLDTFKFLGLEQTLKNALTGLQMGGAKGGADFDPKGRSDTDVMSFCHAFMMELYRYIGRDSDIPAGDIGVGEREIGYLFGAYKKLAGRFDAAMTGKSPAIGGSCVRKEATGYGCVYFLKEALDHVGKELKEKHCALSGAGNVALYTAQKLIAEDAKVVSLSNAKGTAFFPDGLTSSQLERIIEIKEQEHGNLQDFCDEGKEVEGVDYIKDAKPWSRACDIAVPCATQNELDEEDAETLADNHVGWVCEAANMPLTKKARTRLLKTGATILPSKAVNAGGVAISGIERSQNAQHLAWSKDKVNTRLKTIMHDIHRLCVKQGGEKDRINYLRGANVAGFLRVAKAMQAYGSL